MLAIHFTIAIKIQCEKDEESDTYKRSEYFPISAMNLLPIEYCRFLGEIFRIKLCSTQECIELNRDDFSLSTAIKESIHILGIE